MSDITEVRSFPEPWSLLGAGNYAAVIDEALKYATERGLHPHDVHFNNVMMYRGQGIVVDVSDFNHHEHCLLWEHSKKAYYKFYLPYFSKFHPAVPNFLLNAVRKCYQLYKKIREIK